MLRNLTVLLLALPLAACGPTDQQLQTIATAAATKAAAQVKKDLVYEPLASAFDDGTYGIYPKHVWATDPVGRLYRAVDGPIELVVAPKAPITVNTVAYHLQVPWTLADTPSTNHWGGEMRVELEFENTNIGVADCAHHESICDAWVADFEETYGADTYGCWYVRTELLKSSQCSTDDNGGNVGMFERGTYEVMGPDGGDPGSDPDRIGFLLVNEGQGITGASKAQELMRLRPPYSYPPRPGDPGESLMLRPRPPDFDVAVGDTFHCEDDGAGNMVMAQDGKDWFREAERRTSGAIPFPPRRWGLKYRSSTTCADVL